MVRLVFALLLALAPMEAIAQSGKPPIVDDAARARASRVTAMSDSDPVARLNLLLATRELDEAALFVVAMSFPSIVEQLLSPEYNKVIDYINTLPAPELGRLRRGETVIRSTGDFSKREREAAEALAVQFGFEEDWLEAVRIGPLEARVIRVEVTAKKRKKSFKNQTELAWPSTPDRDERSRDALARFFGGARPSKDSNANSVVLVDGSFETEGTIGGAWKLDNPLSLGADSPVAEVSLDGRTFLDGQASVRFFANSKTRLFHELTQRVVVQPNANLKVRAHFKAEDLRVEFRQREDSARLSVAFFDSEGMSIGKPTYKAGRLSTHAWELIEIDVRAPANAAFLQVGVLSAVSGTAWFDGVAVEGM